VLTSSRRSLLTGLIAFAAVAPAIVRASTLMPVHSVLFDSDISDWFTSQDPFVIDAAKQRIFAAASSHPRAAIMKRLINSGEGAITRVTYRDNYIYSHLKAEHKKVDERWQRGEFYRGGIHCAPEEMTPSAWPEILEKARYV
jgi:hypothetical protein